MTIAIPKTTYGPPTFRIKQGATLPPIQYTTVDDTQEVVPIQGFATVEFIYRLKSAAPATAVVRTATVVDAFNGQVRYDWVPADTTIAGEYVFECRVTFTNGEIRTFPNRAFLLFVVEARVN